MPKKRAETERPSGRVSLHIGSSPCASWDTIFLPWFQAASRVSWQQQLPTVVAVPLRSHAYAIKSRLLDHGVSALGIRFVSPAELRELMAAQNETRLALREHLRLLLSIAAEECMELPEDPTLREKRMLEADFLAAKSVARAPDHLLRAIDQLGAAGWDFSAVELPALRKIEARFQQQLADCGFELIHTADRRVLAQSGTGQPIISNIFVTGFNGAHWPLWPLLQAAVASAEEATVLLDDPRDEARDIDETWVGTWEETFAAAEPIGEVEAASTNLTALSSQVSSVPETEGERKTRVKEPLESVYFLVGRDATEQARAIVALTAKFLGGENCERIGILFPQSGALPRLVSRFLESAGIAHLDGIAHIAPSVFDDDAWRAWLELQQNPRLKFLFRFLRATDAKIFDKMSIFEVEDKLRRAYAEVLIDNIDILREFCARSDDKTAIAAGLETIQFFPVAATFVEFLAQTRKSFTQLDWKQHWSEVERLSRNWAERVAGSFSRTIYLRWLREILSAPSLSRDDFGTHPYARVHLLRYAEAEGQQWSHLIFAGLNEEAWPSLDDEFGLVGEQEIDEFNRRNKTLNRRAVKRGRQGEGQWSVREGNTLLLGSTERRQIRRRQLRNLMESASEGIGVTANLYSESFPSRIANPTELFSRLYFAARGRGVSQQTLYALEEQTRAWLKDWSPVDAQKVDSISVGRARYAFDARRQLRAAGEYEFALRGPPDRPVTLRVTEWEAAVKWPAITWIKIFLGVEPDEENSDAWATATGQWVHRWLADSVRGIGEAFVELREGDEIRARMIGSARQFQNQVRELCAACKQPVPDWWTSGWSNAAYVADCLVIKLSGLGNDWSHMAPEWALDSPTMIPLGEERSLRVRGRIDLILARGEPSESRLGFPDLWVIDYKTGRQQGFKLWELRRRESQEEKLRKQLVKGRGVQLGLYALAAHALGASNVRLTLLGLADELDSQFDLSHTLAQRDFWLELHRMQETGVFGMVGPIHSEFGFSRAYPLATLGIDPNLLLEKWAITHPALAIEGEENA